MEKLRTIKITNYKSFSKVFFANLDNLNLFIGANGSGKSNFLEIFNLMAVLLGKKTIEQYSLNNNNDYLINIKDNGEQILSLLFELEISEHEMIVYEILIKQNHEKFYIELEKITNKANNLVTIYKGKAHLQLNRNNSAAEKHLYDFFTNNILYSFYNSAQSINHTSQIKNCVNITDTKLNNNFSNLGAVLYNIKTNYSDIYEQITSLLQMIIPVFLEFNFNVIDEKIEMLWKTTFSSKKLPINLTSDGTFRLFGLVTLLNIPNNLRPTLTLLEEPEIGLHPYAIELLADLIDNYSLDSQVLLTTHSALLIDKLNINKLYIFNIDKNTGNTIVKDIEFNQFKSWLEEYGIGELWRMNILGGTPIWGK